MVNVYDFQEMLQAGCQSKNPRNLYEGVVLRSLLHRQDVRFCCYKKSVSIYKKSEKSMKLMSENLEKLKSTKLIRE